MMPPTDINSFIKQKQLSTHYQSLINQFYLPLAKCIIENKCASTPLVLGITGAQGSGKSTLASFLVFAFEAYFNLNALALSLDDFYHTRRARQKLAKEIHPLFSTRGVPGTHDAQLAITTIKYLKQGIQPVTIPRFDKAIDDRAPDTEIVDKPIDIIIFEGWCGGVTAQNELELTDALNALEAKQDPNGIWRQYANTQLANDYQTLFDLVDQWVMLKAPSFDCVYQWRLEQEDKLRARIQDESTDVTSSKAAQHVMNAEQIGQFIQLYQRITEHTLQTLPQQVHYLFELDAQRNIIRTSQPLSTQNKQSTLTKNTQWLIFTDMDGSLLDHHSYSFEPAIDALNQLEKNDIPVMPITSKTQAELEYLRKDLKNNHPFIIENGAAVFIPQGYFSEQLEGTLFQESKPNYWVKTFVEPRATWQQLIDTLRAEFEGQFITFAEAGITGIMQMTGLAEAAAQRAGQRQFGEPVKWLGDDVSKKRFIQALSAKGANILEGGRFIHVSGKSDKGVALKWLTDIYQQHMPNKKIKTLALGDSDNDIAMLETADTAVLIRSPSHDLPQVNRSNNLYISKHTGPFGWAEGIQHFIF